MTSENWRVECWLCYFQTWIREKMSGNLGLDNFLEFAVPICRNRRFPISDAFTKMSGRLCLPESSFIQMLWDAACVAAGLPEPNYHDQPQSEALIWPHIKFTQNGNNSTCCMSLLISLPPYSVVSPFFCNKGKQLPKKFSHNSNGRSSGSFVSVLQHKLCRGSP